MNAAQRLAAAGMMPVIEMLPRVCISLMLTVGGVLSEYVGLEHPPWQMAGIVLLGPVWLSLTLLATLAGGAAGRQAATLDQWLRWLIVVSVVASVAYSAATGRLAEAPYVAPKLLLFAAVVFLGLMLRRRLDPFHEGLARLAAMGRSPEVDQQMERSLARARPFVHSIWAALLLAALLGVIKPGAEEELSANNAMEEPRWPDSR
jgi:hypothetical protein